MKLRQTSDGAWPTKLPFAVIASNTKIKRATKYTAFELIFGRKCDAIPLLNLSKKYSTFTSEGSSGDEPIHSNSLDDPFVNEAESTDVLGKEMKLIRHQMNRKLD